MTENASVPFEAVLAKLRARIAEDATTIAVLQARIDELTAPPAPAPDLQA